MSGFKFLITLVVIYLIFRSIMRKVLSAVNSEGGSALKGKLGEAIEQMKREMEKARLEAEREAAGMDEEAYMADDPWAELKETDRVRREVILEEDLEAPMASHDRWDAGEERPILHERWDAGDDRPSLHERWEAGDERPSLHERWETEEESTTLWDTSDESHRVARTSGETPETAPEACRRGRKRRKRLKEAVVWKEILDRPVGLR
jgi:hypothetical protein